jgi:hypothetical protein
MITLPRRFFPRAQFVCLHCTVGEGALWAHGDIWLAPDSALNPAPGKFLLLASCYDEAPAIAPDLSQIESLLASLALTIPDAEREIFIMRSAILRAAAREYLAA